MPAKLRCFAVLFFPLVVLYTGLVYLRNKFYDWNIFKICRVSLPVISVGNIQIGGTGKTPLAEYIAGGLIERGEQPVILSRGYGRKSKAPVIIDQFNRSSITSQMVGDEPYLLSRNLPDTVIAVDGDRCRGARQVIGRQTASLFILDDGLQHRRIFRNCEIVLVDVSRWSNWPFLFPLTHFRDVKSSLRRADMIVLMRIDRSDPDLSAVKTQLQLPPDLPVFSAAYQPEACIMLNGQSRFHPGELNGKRVALLCGIAHPVPFYQLVEECGGRIVFKKSFPDHYDYRERDIREFLREAGKYGAEIILTTQKDMARLISLKNLEKREIYYLKIRLILNDPPDFFRRLQELLTSPDDRRRK